MRRLFVLLLLGAGLLAPAAPIIAVADDATGISQLAGMLSGQEPASILAVVAERFAEASQSEEALSFLNEAILGLNEIDPAEQGQQTFFVCVRAARIAEIDPDLRHLLSDCLTHADQAVSNAVAQGNLTYELAALHIRLHEVLLDFGFAGESRLALAFSVGSVWQNLERNSRITLGRRLIDALHRQEDDAGAAQLCLQTLDAVQDGNAQSLNAIWAIVVPDFDCLQRLPDDRQDQLMQSLIAVVDTLESPAGHDEDVAEVAAATSYGIEVGSLFPIAEALQAAGFPEDRCPEGTALNCLIDLALAGAEDWEEYDLNLPLQIYNLTLLAGSPDQQVRARARFQQTFVEVLRSSNRFSDDPAEVAALNREVLVNVSQLQARDGQAQSAANTYSSAGSIPIGQRWQELSSVIYIAEALARAGDIEQAVNFFEHTWPWRTDISYLFGEAPGQGDLLWSDFIRIARFYFAAGYPDRGRQVLVLGTQAALNAGQIVAIGQAQMAFGFTSDARDSFQLARVFSGGVNREAMPLDITTLSAVSQFPSVANEVQLVPGYMNEDDDLFWVSPQFILH